LGLGREPKRAEGPNCNRHDVREGKAGRLLVNGKAVRVGGGFQTSSANCKARDSALFCAGRARCGIRSSSLVTRNTFGFHPRRSTNSYFDRAWPGWTMATREKY